MEIGFVGSILEASSILDRYIGYYKALLQNKLPVNSEWIIEDRGKKAIILILYCPKRCLPLLYATATGFAGNRYNIDIFFLQFIENIPTSLDQSAIIDGATHFGIFFKILLPLLRSAIITAMILKGVATYDEYYMANLYL